MPKLSQIPASIRPPALTDQFVGVAAGPTDVLFSLQQFSRQILTADADFFVSTTGSDSNPGTFAQPWATPQHASDFTANFLDAGGHSVIIQYADGTYAGPVVRSSPPNCFVVYHRGNINDKTKVIWDDSGPAGQFQNALEILAIQGTFQFGYISFSPQTINRSCIENDASLPVSTYFINVALNAPPAGGTFAFTNFNDFANITFGFDVLANAPSGGYTISGTFENGLFNGANNALILDTANNNAFAVGTVFSDAFTAIGGDLSTHSVFYPYTGSFTGKRFTTAPTLGGAIPTSGSGFVTGVVSGGQSFNFFPGSANGILTSGNFYNGITTPCMNSTTVSGLPPVGIIPVGQRALVTDSTVSLSAGLGNVVAGTGGNITPVYSDGTNWRIG